jgi:uncharacterized DUF497 family protein
MAVVTIGEVVFEWDDRKAIANFDKHGVIFEEAATVFRDPFGRTMLDRAHSQDENRFVLIGNSESSRILTVIFVEREDRLRLISARESTPKERRERERRNEKGTVGE